MWTGDCGQTNLCTRNQPCLPSPNTITVSGECTIVFTQGNYASNAQVRISNGMMASYDLVFDGTVEGLRLRPTTGSVSLTSSQERLATLIKSEIEFDFTRDAMIKIERLIMVDTPFKVTPESLAKYKSSWNFDSAQIRMNKANTPTSFLSLFAIESANTPLTSHYFEFRMMNIDLQSAVFISTNVDIALANHRNSRINGASSLYDFSGRSNPATLQFFETDVTNIGNYLVKAAVLPSAAAAGLTETQFAALAQPSILFFSSSRIRGAEVQASQELPRLANRGMNTIIQNSNFSGLSINCANSNWEQKDQRALNTVMQWYTNASIHNCAVCLSSSPQLKSVAFTYNTEDKYNVFTYLKDVLASFNNVNFTLTFQPSATSYKNDRLILDGTVTLLESSNIYTNVSVYVKASARVTVRNYRLTGTVSLEDESRLLSGGANWTLVYPVIFRTVGSGANGGVAKAKVDWTDMKMATFVPSLMYVYPPPGTVAPQIFTADSSVTISAKTELLFAKTHIFWDANAFSTPRDNFHYDIGNFNLVDVDATRATWKQNCTEVLGDWFSFVGTATKIDHASVQYRATYDYKGWANPSASSELLAALLELLRL